MDGWTSVHAKSTALHLQIYFLVLLKSLKRTATIFFDMWLTLIEDSGKLY
jgi:hypothetical protein